ncbi:acyltransferase [candidate division KSB1 bacterium]|nr:acyltransferase [candidate division KSB1 bacterium]
MKIAFVQMNCVFGAVDRNLFQASQLMDSKEADLYVLPELFNTGYQFTRKDELNSLAETIPSGLTCQMLLKIAARKDVYIVAGLAENADGKFYNSSVLIGPRGYISTYRKIHLFDDEKLWFLPGDMPFRAVQIGDLKLGLLICFDWIFPEAMRSLALDGANIICHSANLVLPYCQDAMVTRCLENFIFAVTANRIGAENRGNKSLQFTGKSQITAPDGTILVRGSSSAQEVGVAEIDPLLAWDKNITGRNHLFNDRRPELYKLR